MQYLTWGRLKLYPQPYYIAQAMLILAVAVFTLRLDSYNLRVPFNYSGDSVVILMYIKGLIQDGWPTIIGQLSAPFVYPGAAFPMLTSVDWLIIKLLSVFTAEPGYLLNGFWLLTLVFSAWSASYAAFQLGLSRALSFVSGVLYAFLPFALLRNVAHMNLVYYLVPLLCLLAVVIAGKGEGVRNVKQATIVGLAGCALQGFNYVYYSFFAVLLFGVATLIAYKRGDVFKQIKLPLLAIAVVTMATAINMIPAMKSWHQNGPPPEMGYKYTAEAEVYGAKLRRMLSPHPDNFTPPLAEIAQNDLEANFPNENENTTARLGLYGAFGLLLMIVVALRRGIGDALSQPILIISALGLATLLIITVGGFGAVINLLTVPDIRSYNRFSVYLAFFAIVAAGLWLQEKVGNGTPRWKMAGYFIVGGFATFSLYDQLLDATPLVAAQKNDMRRATGERTAVERLEKTLQDGTAVLELPFTGYPPLAKFHKMESYDHVRPYLWSHHLRWSWPSFSQRHRAWQTKMEALKGGDLINAAIYSGFGAFWIDRFAYQDHGQELIASLTLGKVRQLDIGSGRFVVLDLRDAAADLKASMPEAKFAEHTAELLGNEVLVEWKKGFYGEEQNGDKHLFRWAQDRAKVVLKNTSKMPLTVCVSFKIASRFEGNVRLEGGSSPIEIKTSSIPQLVQFPLSLASGEAQALQFSTGLQRFDVPGDPRELFFYVMDFAQTSQKNNIRCATEERTAVERLERVLQNGTAVLELPFTGRPPLAKLNKMESDDLMRPYLLSHHLKWSWPSFSQRHRGWQTKMAALRGGDLINAAIYSGFGVIWIDRFAYQDDGRELIATLKRGKVKQLDTGSSRFVVLDLRDAAADLKASMPEAKFAEHKSELLGNEVLVEWKKGFYAEEQDPEKHLFRWAQDQAEIVVTNVSEVPLTVCVSFKIASHFEGGIRLAGVGSPIEFKTSSTTQLIQLPLRLASGEAQTLQFSTDLPSFEPPGDPRDLFFYVMDFAETSRKHTTSCSAQS